MHHAPDGRILEKLESQTAMRLISYIFLTLLATTALAQNDDFSFYPSYTPPEGGAEIEIHANSNTYLRFTTAPQVFFGDVASPHVTPLGTVTLSDLLASAAVRAHANVRIEVESQSPVWAMLTLTDNETQHMQIFTPQ